MIVVDTNVIAYLHILGDYTVQAKVAFEKDPVWAAPVLWKSEFRNVLALYMRRSHLSLGDAHAFMRQAELLLRSNEYQVSSRSVLQLVADSRCSAYDCEFVALALELEIPLVSSDKKLLSAFPKHTISLDRFIV